VHREQVVEGGRGLVGERLAGVRDAVLRQVARGVGARADDLAGVRVDQAEDDLQQRGLAGAVGADDRDPLVIADAQVEVAKEVFAAVLLFEVADGDQGVLALLCGERHARGGDCGRFALGHDAPPLVLGVKERNCTRAAAGVKADSSHSI
jgi:hypothetical protein